MMMNEKENEWLMMPSLQRALSIILLDPPLIEWHWMSDHSWLVLSFSILVGTVQQWMSDPSYFLMVFSDKGVLLSTPDIVWMNPWLESLDFHDSSNLDDGKSICLTETPTRRELDGP